MAKEEMFLEKIKLSTEFELDIDNRIIYLKGEVDSELGTDLRLKYNILKMWHKEVFKIPLKDITINISSQGGEIYAITSVLDFYYELLKYDNVKVNTHAQGTCMSAATIIVAGATGERSASRNCKFMLHDMWTEGIEGTAKKLHYEAKVMLEEQMEFFSYYAKFSRRTENLTEKEIIKDAKKWMKTFTKDGLDHYVSSQKFLDLKLIDKIL